MDCKHPLREPKAPEGKKEEPLEWPAMYVVPYNSPWHFLTFHVRQIRSSLEMLRLY